MRATGAALLPFAWGLAHNARRTVVDRTEAWIAVALDAGWVAGSAALVVSELLPLTRAGFWAVVGVAEVVLLCAALQALGLQRAQRRAVPV